MGSAFSDAEGAACSPSLQSPRQARTPDASGLCRSPLPRAPFSRSRGCAVERFGSGRSTAGGGPSEIPSPGRARGSAGRALAMANVRRKCRPPVHLLQPVKSARTSGCVSRKLSGASRHLCGARRPKVLGARILPGTPAAHSCPGPWPARGSLRPSPTPRGARSRAGTRPLPGHSLLRSASPLRLQPAPPPPRAASRARARAPSERAAVLGHRCERSWFAPTEAATPQPSHAPSPLPTAASAPITRRISHFPRVPRASVEARRRVGPASTPPRRRRRPF